MSVKNLCSFLMLAFAASTASFAGAAVTMSDAGTTAPAAGDGFANAGTGGSGGNPYSDNGGLGQSFTLPSGSNYELNSYSLMYDGDNNGGDSFGAGATWDIQVSRFDNDGSGGFAERLDNDGVPQGAQYLSNSFINHQYLDFATIAEPDVGDWVTVDFSGGDVLTLNGGHTYAIQLRSDTGWSRWSTSATDNYGDAKRFGSWGDFTNNYVNPSNSSDAEYTFALNLTEVAVPEPSSLVLLVGMAVSGLVSRRRQS